MFLVFFYTGLHLLPVAQVFFYDFCINKKKLYFKIKILIYIRLFTKKILSNKLFIYFITYDFSKLVIPI